MTGKMKYDLFGGDIMSLVYNIGRKLYINVTNKCTNRCIFCIRDTEAMKDYDLWLHGQQPTAKDIIEELPDLFGYDELVFCGFGEPLTYPDIVAEVASYVKDKREDMPIRINTNGLGELINEGKDVLSRLKGLVDVMSISLNAESAEKYVQVCHPKQGEKAYEAIIDFTKKCKGMFPKVMMSVVEIPEIDVDACAKVCSDLGVERRVRQKDS